MFLGLVSFNANEDSKPVYKKNRFYPRQCYSATASGAEQTTETNNSNWT